MKNPPDQTGDVKTPKTGAWWQFITRISALQVNRDALYIFLKAALRVELLFLLAGVVFFLTSGLITWRLNVKSAEQFIRQTDSICYNPKNIKLSGSGLDSLSDQLNTIARKKNLNGAYPRSFYDEDGRNTFKLPSALKKEDKGYNISQRLRPDPELLGTLSNLTAWSRSALTDAVIATVNSSHITDDLADKQIKQGALFYNRYRLDQFIVRAGYTSNLSNLTLIALLVAGSLLLLTYGLFYYLGIIRENEYQHKQNELHEAAQKSQEALLVWDLAQKKLNKYYDRNLNQNNSIFIVSIVVMLAGFIMVLYGITIYFQAPEKNNFITGIATASGTIVQFIGATFLVIYNSTIKQAIQYTDSLQRTSTIGTSIKILDGITGNEADTNYLKLKTEVMHARIDIAKMLIGAPGNSTAAEPERKKE